MAYTVTDMYKLHFFMHAGATPAPKSTMQNGKYDEGWLESSVWIGARSDISYQLGLKLPECVGKVCVNFLPSEIFPVTTIFAGHPANR